MALTSAWLLLSVLLPEHWLGWSIPDAGVMLMWLLVSAGKCQGKKSSEVNWCLLSLSGLLVGLKTDTAA